MITLAALCLALLCTTMQVASDPPPIFAKLSFAAARAKALAESRFLLVDFSASWCAPCKQMDQKTWIDPQIVGWVERRAIAVQIDIDAEPTLAREFAVGSVPTVVVLRGHDEFDRLGGFQESAALIAWLEGVDRGERILDSLRMHANSDDASERHKLAQALLERRRNAAALPHYLWLWDRGLERNPDQRAVRLSYWAQEIGELCRRLPAARVAFVSRRDAAFALWSQDFASQRAAAEDWVALNAQMIDRQQSVRWYETVRDDKRWVHSVDELREELYAAYLERGDHRAAGLVRGWPGGYAEQLAKRGAEALAAAGEDRARCDAATAELHRDMASLYAAMLACDQDAWAADVARTALATDDGAQLRIALVAEALRARCSRASHVAWLDEVERAGVEVATLRTALQKALAAKR